jgi:hypothetical protein
MDAEQTHIQVQFDISRAKGAIGDLVDRINSLNALGKITDKECKDFLKTLKGIQDKLEKAAKNKKKA